MTSDEWGTICNGMPRWSPTDAPPTWDISSTAELLTELGRAGLQAWTETTAARALGWALASRTEFHQHVALLREGTSAEDVAGLYVRRAGQRRDALLVYLGVAVAAGPSRLEVRDAITNLGEPSWWMDAPPDPRGPRYALRRDAAETIALGALRVARRGAGRCVDPRCGHDGHGRWAEVKYLSPDRDYCHACAARTGRPREGLEAERALFDAVIPVVLSDADSRPRARRARRSPRVEDAGRPYSAEWTSTPASSPDPSAPRNSLRRIARSSSD